MSSKTTAVILCWIPIGGPAAVQLAVVFAGIYQPVHDDGVRASLMPLYYGHLFLQLAISAAASTYLLIASPRDYRPTNRVVVSSWACQCMALVACAFLRWLL